MKTWKATVIAQLIDKASLKPSKYLIYDTDVEFISFRMVIMNMVGTCGALRCIFSKSKKTHAGGENYNHY